VSNLYPWLKPYAEKLNRYIASGRLPSGLLIESEGEAGLNLIEYFAGNLYCENIKNGQACGHCSPCMMFKAGSYPDFFRIKPEEDSTTIKIDAIRKVTESIALASQFEAPRLVVISPAQAMTLAASNSLLKTLEEPSDNTTLILLVDQASAMPATIRSRCQQISINNIDMNLVKKWLAEQGCETAEQYLSVANNMPLVALEMWQEKALIVRDELFESFSKLFIANASPIEFGSKCVSMKVLPVTNWLASWLSDLIKIKQGADKEYLSNIDLYSSLKILAERLELKSLYALSDQLKQLIRLQSGQVNQQLSFENFAINCHLSAIN